MLATQEMLYLSYVLAAFQDDELLRMFNGAMLL